MALAALPTPRSPSLARPALALAGALALFATAGHAGDRESVLYLRAADLEAEGRCEEAVELVRQAHLDGMRDARLGLVGGRCEIRLRRYADALETLDEAKALPPRLAEVDLYRGVALYHLEDFDGAREALDAAREELEGNALLALYSGLLRLQADEPREAALLLERARRADADAVEPVASFYAYLAWRSIEEDERAKAALERVRELDPDGPWLAEAERILTRRHLRERSDSWASLRAGMEYDTNVIVRGNRPLLPEEISDESDWRGAWSLDGGIELLRTEVWSGGLFAAYTGTAQIDFKDFNAHYPTAGAWIDREVGYDTTLRLRYDFGYSWVDEDGYLESHDWTASAHHRWDKAGRTKVAVAPFLRNYYYDLVAQPGSYGAGYFDRDGRGVDVGLEHRCGTGLGDLEIRGGYHYRHYNSKGQEYDYDDHELMLGVHTSLPFESRARPALVIDAWGSFTYEPYDEVSAYALTPEGLRGQRRDRIWQLGAAVERPVTDRLSVVFQYNFVHNGSNVTVYDYDRHIVGGHIQVKLW